MPASRILDGGLPEQHLKRQRQLATRQERDIKGEALG